MDAEDIVASIAFRTACGLAPGGSLCDRPTLDNLVGRDDHINRPPRSEHHAPEDMPSVDPSHFAAFSSRQTQETAYYRIRDGMPLIPDNQSEQEAAQWRMQTHGAKSC